MLKNPSGKDGQKAVCIDPQVAPQPGECLVYSFGIADDWSFDEEMEEYTDVKCSLSIRRWRWNHTITPLAFIFTIGD
jgi:hypothetical protein